MSTYDEQLLAAAPSVTKAELQDGYNADLLREPTTKRRGTPARATPPPPPRSSSHPDPTSSTPLNPNGNSSQVAIATKEHHLPHDVESVNDRMKGKSKPFWRTKKGIIGLVVIGVVIILAAVLGGVLGSRKGGGNSGSNSGSNGNQENGTSGSVPGDGSQTGGTEGGGQQEGGSSITPLLPSSSQTQPSSPVATGQVPGGGTATPPTNPDTQTGQEGQVSSADGQSTSSGGGAGGSLEDRPSNPGREGSI